MDETIATIPKNATEEVRVSLSEYRGTHLVGIRVYANYKSPLDERTPTKKGVALKVERLPELIAALQEAERDAIEAGLLAPADRAA